MNTSSSQKVVKKIPKTQAFRNDEQDSKLNESELAVKQPEQIDLNDEQEAKNVIEAFKAFDLDGDGFVSVREFVSMLNNYATGLSATDIDEIIKESQLDVKGKMDYKEFVDFWRNKV